MDNSRTTGTEWWGVRTFVTDSETFNGISFVRGEAKAIRLAMQILKDGGPVRVGINHFEFIPERRISSVDIMPMDPKDHDPFDETLWDDEWEGQT